MLKYPIFVRSITNLSDARYCAGMGADTLGFCFDPTQKNYLEINLFEAIRGWLSGVKIMAELYKIPAVEGAELAKNIKADYILVDNSNLDYGLHTDIPIIYQIILEEHLEQYPPSSAFVYINTNLPNIDIKNYKTQLQKYSELGYKIIFGCGFDANNIDEINKQFSPYGFGLDGEDELAPGLKDYDSLATIFEKIEL